MQNINFSDYSSNIVNKNHLQAQQVATPVVNNSTAPKLKPQPEADTLELSTKKEKNSINKKKLLTFGAIAGAVVLGGLAIAKVKNTEKIKKEITALYDEIYDSIAQDASKTNLNFEKPELVFKKLGKGVGALYTANYNTVTVNTSILNNKPFIKKDLTSLDGFVNDETLRLNTVFGYAKTGSPIDKVKNRKTTAGESIAIQGSILYHELTHAKQYQSALSTEGGVEKLIEGYKKKFPNISDEDLRKAHPFLFSYKPNELYDSGIRFVENTQEGNKIKNFSYTIDSIVNAFTDYHGNNNTKYYLNLSEISARNGEATYWQKLSEGKLPKPQGIDDETIEKVRDIYANNVDLLLQGLLNARKIHK